MTKTKVRPQKPDRPPLVTQALTWENCQSLAKVLTAEDAHECVALGLTPLQSLAASALSGPAWAVCRQSTRTPVGAFGCNPATGSVWSLWGPMGRREQAQVLRETPAYVEIMRGETIAGRRTLHNFVRASNVRSLRWLRAAKCFNIADEPIDGPDGHPWFYFEVKRITPHV